MSFYPWSVLGLEAAATELEIRRAFAKALRAVRPDEDARGFQALVQARNRAIELARSNEAQKLALLQDEEETDDEQDDLFDDHHEANFQMMLSEDLVPAAIDLAGQPEPSPGWQASAPVPATVAIALEAGQPQAEPAPTPIELSLSEPPPAPLTPSTQIVLGGAGKPSADGQASSLAPPSAPPEPLSTRDILETLARALAVTDVAQIDQALLAHILQSLEGLPLPVRAGLEFPILRLLAAEDERRRDAKLKSRRSTLARILWPKRPKPDDPAVVQVRRNLLLALDEVYGWSTSDRRVYQVLTNAQGQRLIESLNVGLRVAQVAREGVPKRFDGDGLPILEVSDMRAFFGTEYAVYASHYVKAKAARRWPSDWRWSLLLFAWWYAIGLRNVRLVGMWILAFLASSVLINVADRLLAPWLTQYTQANRNDILGFATLLGASPLIALHVYVARYPHRLELERLARLAARADRKGLFETEARARFLRAWASGLRHKRSSPPSWGLGGWWYYGIIGLIALVRILGLIGGH